MLHSKFAALNLIKAAMITLLILSCIPFVGCDKADKMDMLIQQLKDEDTRAVEPLIAALKDKDRDVREEAAAALGKIGTPAVEPLIAALKDKDSDVQMMAAEVLGTIKDTRAVEPLIAALAALKDESEFCRKKVATALGKIGAPAVEPLIAALKDKESSVRMGAAEALGKIKDARAVEPLFVALKDENWIVREKAADALGNIKDARAVEPLIAALKDNNMYVQMMAAEALGTIRDTRAVEPLIAALAALKDENEFLREKVAKALGEIKDTRAVEPLITALKDKDRDVRRAAAGALGKTGEPSLIKALKDSKRAVNTLVESLVCWDSPAAKMLSGLGWMPESDSNRIHFWVGLRDGEKLKEKWNTTKDVLLKDVKSNNYLIIENALYAFVSIGKSEIIPVLIETLNTAGNATMAEAYLNCGNGELGSAAREWASSHGYSIFTSAGNAPVSWGHW